MMTSDPLLAAIAAVVGGALGPLALVVWALRREEWQRRSLSQPHPAE